jgi:hypothetical protein
LVAITTVLRDKSSTRLLTTSAFFSFNIVALFFLSSLVVGEDVCTKNPCASGHRVDLGLGRQTI